MRTPWRDRLFWQQGLFRTLILLAVVPGTVFVVGSVGVLAYMFWPRSLDAMDMPAPRPGATHVVLLAHGVGDTPRSWTAPLKRSLDSRIDDGTQVIALDWSSYAGGPLRCSVDGKRIGNEIGRRLAISASLASVHLVGHSCGAFVAYGVCQTLRADRNDIAIQTTYLDPVSIYGGLFWNYGLDRFGSCADFSDAYIDIEDQVPGSNQRLPHAYTFEVTEVRKASSYSGLPHVWPTVYYAELVRAGREPDLRKAADLHSRYPRGALQRVSE